jgi:hypothetical protein
LRIESGAGGDPDGRMRLLSSGRLDDDVLVAPEPALVRKRLVRGPGFENHRERLFEAHLRLLPGDAEAGELRVTVALADAEVETPAGQKVEGRAALGQ